MKSRPILWSRLLTLLIIFLEPVFFENLISVLKVETQIKIALLNFPLLVLGKLASSKFKLTCIQSYIEKAVLFFNSVLDFESMRIALGVPHT